MDTLNLLIILVVTVMTIAGMWKAFEKAGLPGWSALVPIYNAYCMVVIAGFTPIYFFILFIPFVNGFFYMYVCYRIAASFNQGILATLLMIFLPFIGWPMISFGDSQYNGNFLGY